MQQKIWIGLILTLITIIFIAVYWAMEPGRQESARLRQQREAAERGGNLYGSFCASCHGAQGEGAVGPALKGTARDEGTLQKSIARGVPGTAMPAWGKEEGGPFNRQQITDLATFIKNWESARPATPASSQPIAPSGTTALDVGKLFAERCSACHGKNREGVSGLGPALTPERLAALNDAVIRDTISNGRSGTAMPAFKATLSAEEIDSLLRFLKSASP